MRVGVKANDNVVTFSYEIESEDRAAITEPNGQVIARFLGGDCRFIMPSGWSFEDTHPDLFAVAAVALAGNFMKRLRLPFPVSEPLAQKLSELYKFDTQPTDGSLSCEVIGDPGSTESQYGGVKFKVAGMRALRLNLSLTNPENVRNLYVYAYGRKQGQLMRWQWGLLSRQRKAALPNPLVFVAGEPSGYFRLSGEVASQSIEEIDVFIRLISGTQAGFVLQSAEVAHHMATYPDPEEFAFQQVDLQAVSEAERLSSRVGASKHVGLRYEPSGDVRCLVEGDPDSSQHQFGGVVFDVSGLDALRFNSTFIDPQNIIGMWVDGCDERGRRITRWEWRLSPDSPVIEGSTTHILVPGRSSAFFDNDGETSGANIRSVHVFIRLVPGQKAGFIMHEMELGSAVAPSSQPVQK